MTASRDAKRPKIPRPTDTSDMRRTPGGEFDSPPSPPNRSFGKPSRALKFRALTFLHVVLYRRISSIVAGVGVRIGVNNLISELTSGTHENLSGVSSKVIDPLTPTSICAYRKNESGHRLHRGSVTPGFGRELERSGSTLTSSLD